MVVYSQSPMPSNDTVVNLPDLPRPPGGPRWGLASTVWMNWLAGMSSVVERASRVEVSVAATEKQESIGATDISGGTLPAGLYRFTYYARVTVAAGTSSSLQVTLDWKDGATQTKTFTAMTGNTTLTHQSESYEFLIEATSPVRYSTTYASVGAPGMEYKLYMTLERVSQ